MSTDQILFGVGLILVLAVGSQVLASRLRIPALIILLPAGFTAGALTTDVNPQHLLGPAFQPLVSLAVAVIFYDSGLALEWGKVQGRARRVVPRLVIWGVPITMAFAAVLAGPLLGMSAGAALMTRRDLGGVRADGGGPAAGFRSAVRSPPADTVLGGLADRPGWGHPGRGGVPRRAGEHQRRARPPAGPVPPVRRHRRGWCGCRRGGAVVVPVQA